MPTFGFKSGFIAVVIAGAALGSSCAQAQLSELAQVDQQVLSCLQKGPRGIDYPAVELDRRQGGALRYSLRFTAPDLAPEIELLYRAASDAMVDEVKELLRSYRLPCMKTGWPVLAVQEFRFEPVERERITWTAPRAVADRSSTALASKERLIECARPPKSKLSFDRADDKAANLLVNMRFENATDPPSLSVAYASVDKAVEKQVLSHLSQYRLGCALDAGKPITFQQFVGLRASGQKRLFADEVPLRSFLSSIKGIRSQHVDFDFKTMACPFKVAWTLGRPAIDNRVGELGEPNLNRTEFLAWLATLEMDLKPDRFEELLGQLMVIHVPCGFLKLGAEG